AAPVATPEVREVARIGGRSSDAPAANDLPAANGIARAATATPIRKAGGAASIDVTAVLLAVVAEATGYPTEMLELDMDLESDLGIDSIKRVEILSLLSKRIPDSPSVDPEHLGGLRTLRQVLEFVSPGQSGGKAAAAGAEAESEAQGAGEQAAAPLEHREVVAVRLPPGAGDEPAFSGPVLVTEDEAGLGVALVEALRHKGVDATLVAAGARSGSSRGSPGDAALERIEARGAQVPRADADPGFDRARALILIGDDRPDVVQNAFASLQAAAPALRSTAGGDRSLLVTVSRRDGAFGHVDPLAGSPLQAGLAGLAKTAAQEWPEVRCRALDVSSEWPIEVAADAIAAELCEAGPREAGLGPAGRIGLGLHARAGAGSRKARLEDGALIVATGGARGVTAACTVELAGRIRPALLLLGRSPLPGAEQPWLEGAEDEAAIKRALLENGFPGERPTPRMLGDACRRILAEREVRATIAALEAAGASVLYRQVDARDPAQVAAAVAEARRIHGPVRGVVHGAGVLRDKRIEEKSADDFSEVWSTKVDALQSLLAAVGEDELAFLALFTSVTGRFGRRGQSDYAAANEALTAIALRESARRPGCHVIAFDWGPWEGGMVTPALRREFEREGIDVIPLGAGASLFADEVCATRAGAVERVIGAGFPSGEAPPEARGRLLSWRRIDPSIDRYLDDHRLAGQPVLPVAMMTELFAAAATEATGAATLAVEGFRLFKGVVLEDGPVSLGVWSAGESPCAEGTRLELELRGMGDRVHARADVIVGPRPPPEKAHPPLTGTPPDGARSEAAAVYRDRRLFHGPRFHAIEAILGIDDAGVTARLRAAPTRDGWIGGADASPFAIDPLALDGIFQLAVLSCRRLHAAPSLPSRFGAFRQLVDALPAEGVEARLLVRESDESRLVADCDLVAADGAVVAKLEGYVCTVSASLEAAYEAAPAAGLAPVGATANGARSAATSAPALESKDPRPARGKAQEPQRKKEPGPKTATEPGRRKKSDKKGERGVTGG
ncbi:MAG TPA: SDR family NAD(P)-dependent oxidoreductase, partial [Vulgatibacter sp.]